jgi:ATP-dependent Clp protease ATP-binding subunit ClpC
VVLLDEIEKAHPEALNMLLQIMEDGHLTDAKGRKVDFRNTIFIMTSNVGARQLSRQQALGFDVPQDERERLDSEYDEMRDKVLAEMKRLFKPEFLNRIDKVIVFKPLTRGDLREIVDIQIRRMAPRLEEQGIKVDITSAARELIAEEGHDPEFGARPLRRAIMNLVEDPLSEKLLAGEIQHGDPVLIDAEDGELIIQPANGVGPSEAAEPEETTEPAPA